MKKILLILMAIFAFGIQNLSAQDGIKIVTGHPDFKLKVTRCAASGKTVVLDMVVTNLSDSDIEQFKVHGSRGYSTTAYDDQGNIYDTDVSVKIANKQYTPYAIEIKLVAGVPTKYSLMIENVSPQAETLVLVEPDIYVPAWKITNKTVKLRNIPITRE